MPHKVGGSKCFRIDRRFKGVGRIAVSSGTDSRKRFKTINAMLTELYEDGKLDVLRAIRDGRLSPLEVYSAHRNGRVGYLAADVALCRPLWETVEGWVPVSADAEASRRRYAVSMRALQEHGPLGPTAAVSELADVDWRRVRADWPNSGADFNRMRAAVSRFLTMTLGDKHHPFRRRVVSSFPRARESRGRVPEIDVDLFWRIMEHAPDYLVPTYVTLAVTGLRVRSEYLRLEEHHLRPLTREIEVPGTKTEGSAGVVRVGELSWPWVEAAVPSPLRYKALRKHWNRACEAAGAPDLVMHDLRHLLGMELAEAGRPEASVQASLRHDDPTMTRRYTKRRDRGENARQMDELMFPAEGPAREAK